MPQRSARRGTSHWIEHRHLEDERFWETEGKRTTHRDLVLSIASEHIGFSVWSMWTVRVLHVAPYRAAVHARREVPPGRHPRPGRSRHPAPVQFRGHPLRRPQPDDEWIRAIGECAAVQGRCHGLPAPGLRMATVVARHLAGLGPDPFTDTAQPVRLKVLGLQVTGFGDIHAGTEGAVGPCERDHTTGAYRKQLLAADGTTVLGRVEVSAAV